MSTTALSFILLSALLHAGWNTLMKGTGERFGYSVAMHVFMLGPFTALVLFAGGGLRLTPWMAAPAAGAALFFSLYHFFLARAYDRGDLSLLYPLTTMGPVFIPFWGFVLLGERLSLPGVSGVLLILWGAYSIQFRRFSPGEILRPLRNREPGVLAALGAAFFYSWGAVFDKMALGGGEVLSYTWLLVLFMTLTQAAMAFGMGTDLRAHLRGGRRYAAIGSLVLLGSFLTYRMGLRFTEVTYAASVRQVNALFGVAAGITLFGEPFGRYRIAGALLVGAGVGLIRFWG